MHKALHIKALQEDKYDDDRDSGDEGAGEDQFPEDIRR